MLVDSESAGPSRKALEGQFACKNQSALRARKRRDAGPDAAD
jgi:hypothetical protein